MRLMLLATYFALCLLIERQKEERRKEDGMGSVSRRRASGSSAELEAAAAAASIYISLSHAKCQDVLILDLHSPAGYISIYVYGICPYFYLTATAHKLNIYCHSARRISKQCFRGRFLIGQPANQPPTQPPNAHHFIYDFTILRF